MSNDANYFLREWTVEETRMDDGNVSPYRTPESVAPGYAYRFHRQDGRIVCQPVGPQQNGRDAWAAAAFVHEPVHDRLLGVAILGGKPWVLEITRWNRGNGKPGIRCGYIRYKHTPHVADDEIYHEGVWHGSGD